MNANIPDDHEEEEEDEEDEVADASDRSRGTPRGLCLSRSPLMPCKRCHL